VPINQEDMAYTLLTFSYVVLRAFRDLKIPVSNDETKAYIHCWNVIGHVMGVRDELLAETFDQAEQLFSTIKTRQAGRSENGQALTRAVAGFMVDLVIRNSGHLISRTFVKHVPAIFMRELLDGQTAAMLGIPRLTALEWVALKLIRSLAVCSDALYQKLIQALGNKFGLLLVQEITTIPRGWNRQLFQLPEQIRVAWKIKPNHQTSTPTVAGGRT
jgi:mpaB/rubber oxygenase-like protein